MNDCLFITGGTGFIGRRLIAALQSSHPERRVVALVRDASRASRLGNAGVELVEGDVTRAQLGMSTGNLARLSSEVTQIVHGAGEINFSAPLHAARAANVFGTQQAIHFARSCRRLQRFAHLSTISVHGTREGVLSEEPSPPGQRFVNSYQQSKHEAEWIVLRALREVPAEIFRISLVGADSADGVVSQFNYVHHLIRHLPNGPLAVMPGHPNTCVDLITADWLIAALAYLFDHRFEAGAVRNLSAGPGSSLTLSETLQVAREAMEAHLGTEVRLPHPVSAEEFQRTVADSGDVRIREAARIVGPHIQLLGTEQWFDNARSMAELEGSVPPPPPLRSWLAGMIRYCLRSNWGESEGHWSMIDSPVSEAIHTR